jgi:hypothetical protein
VPQSIVTSARFESGDVGPGPRAEYWRHVVGETVGPLDVRTPGGLDARDRLRAGEAGAVRVVELSIGKTSAAERAPAHPPLGAGAVQDRRPGAGRGVVEHNGREALQEPSDPLVDLSRPCRWSYSSAQVVAAVFPRALLPLPASDLARLTGLRIRGDQGPAALVSSLARRLPGHLGDGVPTAPASAPPCSTCSS